MDGETSTSGRSHDGPGPRQLVALALQVHNGFNSAQLTLDSHTDAALAELRVDDPDAQTFVRQVVYGMVRYRKLFGCLLDAFYHRNRCAGCTACCAPAALGLRWAARREPPCCGILLAPGAARWQPPGTHLPTHPCRSRRSGSALRADAALYRLLGYLAVFRLRELGFAQFR
jgi:hypothetical protein